MKIGFAHLGRESLGIEYLSAVLKRAGHRVQFIDALRLGFSRHRRCRGGYIVGLSGEETVSRIEPDTDLVGLSVPFSHLAAIAHDLADLIKGALPRALVVMGGVYPSTQPRMALKSRADCIVAGEGETALRRLADGADPGDLPGVYRPDDRQAESLAPAPPIEDVNTLPMPDCAIPEMDWYFRQSPRGTRLAPTASIISSRGCPFACDFCSIHPVYGRQWRARSAENVLEEIRRLVSERNIGIVEFEDDNLTLDRARTVEILEGMIRINESPSPLRWRAPNGVRIDTLDKEAVELIGRSGCAGLSLGLEHGDPEMLGIMNKQLDLDKVHRVVQGLCTTGIPAITLFVIVGYPGETRKRFERGLAYLRRLRALGPNVKVCTNIAQPYPGTVLEAKCVEEGWIAAPDEAASPGPTEAASTDYTVRITTGDFIAREVLRRRNEIRDLFDPPSSRLSACRRGIGRMLDRTPRLKFALKRLLSARRPGGVTHPR